MPSDQSQRYSERENDDPSCQPSNTTACRTQHPADTPTDRLRAYLRSGKVPDLDDLDDYSGDFWTFGPLGDMETADMRHQRERLNESPPEEPNAGESCPPASEDHEDRPSIKNARQLDPDITHDENFVAFSAERCLHRYARREGCRRCIDRCPSGAVQAGDPIPLFNHSACLGCAACVTACPTGALHWLRSGQREISQSLKSALEPVARQDTAPLVVFHEPGEHIAEAGPEIIGVQVDKLGLIGMDIMLSAMAMGAAGVFVLVGDSVDQRVRLGLETEIHWSMQVLSACGFNGDRIGVLDTAKGLPQAPSALDSIGVPPAQLDLDVPWQSRVRSAAGHLARLGRRRPDSLSLSADAPFGAVRIEDSKCTVCMACAGACQVKALEPLGGEVPGLAFTEMRCAQCGLCAQVCPEQAITLVPRLNLDLDGAASRTELYKSEPMQCASCGRPFASARLIARLERKLRQHWMYSDQAARIRLHMCDRCRVQDIFFTSRK